MSVEAVEAVEARGGVVLVGAGPGDPRLITVAGAEALQAADVVFHDRLIPSALLDLAGGAERINVGKAPGAPSISQNEINDWMIEHARRGRRVVRLKGGDPFVFGRGGEEAAALASSGIPLRIVPGVSSAYAAAAAAGIAVTDRRAASSVTVVTGSEGGGGAPPVDWRAVAALGALGGTIVVMMGWRNLDDIVRRLIAGGLPPRTPAAAVGHAWSSSQQAIHAVLEALPDESAELTPPVTVVIGETVRLATPEAARRAGGPRILVTRASDQAAPLVNRLRAFHAEVEVIELPTIAIQPSAPAPIDDAVRRLPQGGYDILALTSANGVRHLWQALRRSGLDARALAGVRVAAIGSETARALQSHGVAADLVPAEFTSAALAEALTRDDLRGARVLLARAAQGSALLSDRLREAGAFVDDLALYRVVTPVPDSEALRHLARGVDLVTLTSPSTAEGLAALTRGRVDLDSLQAVCIGPVTAAAAVRLGFPVVGVAETHTIEGLVQAVGRYLASLPPAAAGSLDMFPHDAPAARKD